MYVRLAFAVAAHLESEILIVDEVLAVGDAEFQKKCLGKMGEISNGQGRTVLFVSHNMGSILQLTKKALVLESGCNKEKLISSKDAVKNYQSKNNINNKVYKDCSLYRRGGNDGRMLIEQIIVNGNCETVKELDIHEDIEIEFVIKSELGRKGIEFLICIYNQNGEIVSTLNSADQFFSKPINEGENRIFCKITNINLSPGEYFADISITQDLMSIAYDFLLYMPIFTVAESIQCSNWPDRPNGFLIFNNVLWH
jgi:lipopolysaccharide transport system ATP-binding protein